MWILAIPVGVLALLGAYRAAKMLTKLLRKTKVGANSEPISYGLVVLTTAFMVVPWLLPPVGILRLIVALAFIAYLILGMEQIYRYYKGTKRAAQNAAISVKSVAVGLDKAIFSQSILTVAALVASQAPEISEQLATKLQGVPEVANMQAQLRALTSEATDVFGKAGLLQDLQVLRDYPESALKVSALARELSKDSAFGVDTTLDEIDRALGLK